MGAFRACLGKIARKEFILSPRVTLMRSDGSTIPGRLSEPRFFVQMPLNIKEVSEDERRIILAARKRLVTKVEEEVLDDNYDFRKYANLSISKQKK